MFPGYLIPFLLFLHVSPDQALHLLPFAHPASSAAKKQHFPPTKRLRPSSSPDFPYRTWDCCCTDFPRVLCVTGSEPQKDRPYWLSVVCLASGGFVGSGNPAPTMEEVQRGHPPDGYQRRRQPRIEHFSVTMGFLVRRLNRRPYSTDVSGSVKRNLLRAAQFFRS